MKKIITLIAILICSTLVGFAQSSTIHFDNGKYDMVLHPTNENGKNKEVVTLTSYDAISQSTNFNRIEIEYEIVNPQRMMYDNRKMLNNFAKTELIGIGAALVGSFVSYESIKHKILFTDVERNCLQYVGIGMMVAGGITCIVGYIPLLKGTDLYVTKSGIGIRYNIKSLK